ncbi:hypothetical protein A2619_04060 [candidate division WWE3 bacterium RIFOXYD1_FULL_39_9]|uniref:Uncharacterized protein n=1 Tax=candidate division WWE3 bacterium RIFOXYD1_FULL_39_9 TaxID=1802649 RepID=A0A1F4X9G2_UNCKA|nr:MAG: hypothetical protein A2619_04060 [candidate division WWE3 bacterium RIFOXYD1_FULL_39_9]
MTSDILLNKLRVPLEVAEAVATISILFWVRLTLNQLTTPELIRLNLDKLFLALEDMVQVELIRNRWKEIKIISAQATPEKLAYTLAG